MEHRIRSAVFNIIETLETRRLLASISGTVIEDLDNDGSRDGRERALAGVTVFLDQNRNRQLDFGESSVVTDASGFYEFTGLPAGQYFVGHLPPASYGQNSPPRQGFGAGGESDFDIDLHFPANSLSTAGRSLFESAAARWEKVLVGDLQDIAGDEDFGDVDDIVITATGPSIDGKNGVLARAAPVKTRDDETSTPNLPYTAIMQFDNADLKDDGIFETILHEMGHALGFTVFTWDQFDPPLVNNSAVDPRFLGQNAVHEYNELFDNQESGVPLEDFSAGQGSSFSHFPESVFKYELMTPNSEGDEFGEVLSRLTVGVMEDMGYEVDYRGADPYDPFQFPTVPPTNALTAGGGPVDFTWAVDLEDDVDAARGRDFSSRLNRRPTIDAVRSDNAFYAINDIIKLRAVGANDLDVGDSPTAVAFYVETNSIPGLQTGAGGDTFVNTDESPAGGFRVNANGESLGLAAGMHTFYARAYDELLTTGKTKMVDVQLFDPANTPVPSRPTSIRALPISASEIQVLWNDRSNNEFGFRIERARDEFFNREVRRFNVDANVTSFLDTGVASGTNYYYRVRAFNVSGATGFAGPTKALTANLGERVIDVNSAILANSPEVSTRGDLIAIDDTAAIAGTSLGISGGGRIDFSPSLEFNGDYFLYARWSDPISDQGRGVFDILDSNGRQRRQVTVDENVQGTENGYVLIGKYAFNNAGDGAITFRPSNRSQTVNLDAIRLLPAFDPTTRR